MLDFVIGRVTNVFNDGTFQINVTHIGTHNKFRYNTFETIAPASNNTGYHVTRLYGMKVRCHIRYRDLYNRLYADVVLEP